MDPELKDVLKSLCQKLDEGNKKNSEVLEKVCTRLDNLEAGSSTCSKKGVGKSSSSSLFADPEISFRVPTTVGGPVPAGISNPETITPAQAAQSLQSEF